MSGDPGIESSSDMLPLVAMMAVDWVNGLGVLLTRPVSFRSKLDRLAHARRRGAVVGSSQHG